MVSDQIDEDDDDVFGVEHDDLRVRPCCRLERICDKRGIAQQRLNCLRHHLSFYFYDIYVVLKKYRC